MTNQDAETAAISLAETATRVAATSSVSYDEALQALMRVAGFVHPTEVARVAGDAARQALLDAQPRLGELTYWANLLELQPTPDSIRALAKVMRDTITARAEQETP